MLALASALLFALVALAALLTLADCAIAARQACDRLMHEKALMQGGLLRQISPRERRLRVAARRGGAVILPRRSPMLRPLSAPARGVA